MCIIGSFSHQPVVLFYVMVILIFGQQYVFGLSFFTKPPQEDFNTKLLINTTVPNPLNSPENFKPFINIHLDNKTLRDCPDMNFDLDGITQNQFSKLLTNECRYDKLTKPQTINGKALNVSVKIDIKHIEAIDQLKFRMDMIMQYKYMDPRLNFEQLSPNRTTMIGRDILTGRIWVPHLMVLNEKSSTMMGFGSKDQFIAISPQGEVVYSYRMSTVIYCWMNLKKFPFDKQICSVNLQTWTYNASEMMLFWEEKNSVTISPQLHLAEFCLEDYWNYPVLIDPLIENGAFVGDYSGLVLKFKVAREVGFYIMDYFLPSIMLVVTSWGTFWLQADATPPRATLGTATMLSFITLASSQSKNLPKVSYIKVSEIWFLGCSFFIFASMVEFAFVNIIWRRRKDVELKRVSPKYIFKSTITPGLARKELYKSKKEMDELYSSNGSLDKSSSSIIIDDLVENKEHVEEVQAKTWTTMTPQQVSIWIDKKSRVVFPLCFLIFNIIFWIFVFCW
nr:glycine receptor subunit alphaZ1-like [Onthophagus taurus]